jgi:Coiled-coil domain-containing protein 124 /Oxs1
MAGKRGGGGGGESTSKKAQGQARKAEAAAEKQRAKDRAAEAAEADTWKKGSKDSSKAEAARAKQEEAARKKAEKAALLAAEEASLPAKAKGTSGAKKAEKKNAGGTPRRGTLDLDQLDGEATTSKKGTALHASGIENALDALDITSSNNEQVERHPERRFKAAYTIYEERRLEEMKGEKGLRRNQKIEQIRKEFEKHPDNPFNQASAKYNASRDEVKEIREKEKEKVEARLTNAGSGS